MSEDTKGLDPESIVTVRKIGRRSSIGVIGGTVLGGLALAVAAPNGTAHAKVTDSDGGRCADPGGRGRGPQRRGVTDSDGGPCADPGGMGRGHGGGHGRSGCTDSDGGRHADPGGNGRHCGRH